MNHPNPRRPQPVQVCRTLRGNWIIMMAAVFLGVFIWYLVSLQETKVRDQYNIDHLTDSSTIFMIVIILLLVTLVMSLVAMICRDRLEWARQRDNSIRAAHRRDSIR
ncbi:hypothetical protein IPG36_07940 [bacterium]|nr:MAG: hypothetical protein IPG36_07940 [bacterium]